MAEIDWVRVIADQSCEGKLERRPYRPDRWVSANGDPFPAIYFSNDTLQDKLIVSAVLVTDAAIMRMMR